MVYCILVSSIMNYSIRSYANAVLPATLVAMGNCWEPVATCALAFAVDGAAVTRQHAAGCALVVAGMGVYLNVLGAGPGGGVAKDGGGDAATATASAAPGDSGQTRAEEGVRSAFVYPKDGQWVTGE